MLSAPRVLAATAVLGVVVALVWALGQPSRSVVGSNHIPDGTFAVKLGPSEQFCDGLGQSLNPGTGVQITVGTYGGPAQPLRLTVDHVPGPRLDTYREGTVVLPLPASKPHAGGLGCVRNLGTRTIALGGRPKGGGTVDGKPVHADVAFSVVTAHPPTWGSRAGAVLRRVNDATGSWLGGLTVWVILLLGVGCLALVATSLLRWAR